jgi:hypothetical protein
MARDRPGDRPTDTPTDRVAALRMLFERAERARAQAIAQCQSLEWATFTTSSRTASSDCRPRVSQHAPSHGGADVRMKELEETVDGLLKRLESQAPIEQAKGIIIAQTHCDPDHAFEILRRASQRSNTKLRVLAVDLVARTAAPPVKGAAGGPAATAPGPPSGR